MNDEDLLVVKLVASAKRLTEFSDSYKDLNSRQMNWSRGDENRVSLVAKSTEQYRNILSEAEVLCVLIRQNPAVAARMILEGSKNA